MPSHPLDAREIKQICAELQSSRNLTLMAYQVQLKIKLYPVATRSLLNHFQTREIQSSVQAIEQLKHDLENRWAAQMSLWLQVGK